MKDFNLRKYISENPLLKENTSNSEDFLGLLMEIAIENYCEENNILKENLNENFLKKLKSKFSELPSKVKSKIKDTIDDVKSKTKDTKEFFKDITSVPKDLDPQKLLRTIQILKTKKNLNEEDLGEFTSIEQIKSLKPGDTFTWKGKKIEDFTANDMPVYNDDAGKEDGILKPNVVYVVSTPDSFEDGNGDLIRMPGFIGSKEYFEEVEESKEGMWARKMFDKYPWTEKLLRVLFAGLGIGSIVVGSTDIEDLFGDGDTVSRGGEAGTTQDPYVDFLDTGDGNALTDTDDVQTGNVKIIPTDANNSTSDNVVDKVDQALNDANVNIGDTNLNNTDTNSAAVQTYNVGEYQLSDGESDEIVKDLVTKTLQDLNQQLEDLKGKNVTSIDLDIDFGGTVSNQADGDSNQADDGSDLIDGRISTAEKISKQAGEQITKIVKNALGDNVKVNIDYNKVDTHSSVSNQTVQDAVDNMGTQSSFETVSIGDIAAKDVPPTETPNDIPNLIYNFLYTRYKPDDGKRLATKDSPTKSDAKPKPSPKPTPKPDTKSGVAIAKGNEFKDMNRNNQIATILSVISPSLDIFAKLEAEGIKSELTGTNLEDIRQNEKASDELKKLAQLIVNTRKSPNTLINKISKATGVKFDTRARAKMTSYGEKGKSASGFRSISESVFTEIVTESMLDDMVKDEDIASKKIDLVALLGTMYASTTQKDNKRLSILNTSALTDSERNSLKGLGFGTKDKSDRYVFIDDEEAEDVKLEPTSGKSAEKDSESETTQDVSLKVKYDYHTDEEPIKDKKLEKIDNLLNKRPEFKKFFSKLEKTQELPLLIIGIFLKLNKKFQDKTITLRVLNKIINNFNPEGKSDAEVSKMSKNKLKSKKTPASKNKQIDPLPTSAKNFSAGEIAKAQSNVKEDKQETLYDDTKNALQAVEELPQLTQVLDLLISEDLIEDFFLKVLFPKLPNADAQEIQLALIKARKLIQQTKEKNIAQPFSYVTTVATEGFQIDNFINSINEALTPLQASNVEDKYKETYINGMLNDNPLKLSKYPNPDGMALGRAIKLSKKETPEIFEGKMTPAEEKILMGIKKQVGGKSKLEPKHYAIAKKLAKESNLSEQSFSSPKIEDLLGKILNSIQNLNANVKLVDQSQDDTEDDVEALDKSIDYLSAALTKKDPIDIEIDQDLYGRFAKPDTDKVDEDLERKSTTYEKVAKFIKDELESNNVKNKADLKQILRAIQNKKTYALPMKRQNMLQNLMRQAKKIKESGKDIAGINMDNYKKSNMKGNRLTELVKAALMGPVKESNAYIMAADKARDAGKKEFEFPKGSGKMHPVKLKADIDESFKSLSKDIDKQKGKTKEDGDNIAGFIANRKREGAGKGPTKKMKKREGIKERIFKELRGDINEQDYKFQDANDERVKLLRPLMKSIALQAANAIEKMEKSPKLQKINDQEGAIGISDLSLALGVEVLAALEDKI